MYMILRPKLFDMEMEIFQFTPEMARNISQKLGMEFFRTHIVSGKMVCQVDAEYWKIYGLFFQRIPDHFRKFQFHLC